MSHRRSMLRTAVTTYKEFMDSAAGKIARLIVRDPVPPPVKPAAAKVTTTNGNTNSRPLYNTSFTRTTQANNHSTVKNMLHRLSFFQPTANERVALSFSEYDDSSQWRVLDDNAWGGKTQASVHFQPYHRDGGTVYSMVFSGTIHPFSAAAADTSVSPFKQDSVMPFAQALKPGTDVSPTGERTPIGMLNGFSACISPAYQFPDLNLDAYHFLAVTMKSDGRAYMFNVRCRERLPLIHQARIPAESPRPMHTKEVRFEQFTSTLDGKLKFMQLALPRDRIESFGFSVTGPPGPFRLEIESIVARKGVTNYERNALPKEEVLRMEQEARIEAQGRSLWWLEDQRKRQRTIQEQSARELDDESSQQPKRR